MPFMDGHYEDMSVRQLNHLLLLFLLSVFLSTGCAHKPVSHEQAASADLLLYENKQIATGELEQIPSAPGFEEDSDDDFSDDELDLFDDEFEEDKAQVADPLAFWNRAMFHFNDKFYFWILKPVARGYRAVFPSMVRVGVRNFFTNLTTPIRVVNCILQCKLEAATCELGRFLVNSTVGVLGFGNPAKKYPKLNPSEEDLGQTLGAYGIGNGFYIVWPFLGPSTLRDSVGLVGDLYLNPVSYIEPAEAAVGITGYKTVNETSLKIGDYESLKEAAINPYGALRDAYIQHRKSKVQE
jgi:phospholipid-binding lipoprotein MlaA